MTAPTSPTPYAEWSSVRFPTVRRGGYDRAAVDAYVERAAVEIGSLHSRTASIVETVAHADSAVGEAARVLAHAEHIASEVRAQAQADADAARAAAEAAAADTVAAAAAEAEAIVAAAVADAAQQRADAEEALTADLAAREQEAADRIAAAEADLAERTATAVAELDAALAARDTALAARDAADARFTAVVDRLRRIGADALAAADAPLDVPADVSADDDQGSHGHAAA